ncbi:xanthine dehydrogenase/oxidase-like isoform X2 [Orbicella faveolata]|uniref:xanthine dehydrogenase/oxidase-like isoform X1 n=1 Tax=Orbicella faveolata TaxID=48498 RepID=UPI0009E23626|nr:xanthine dehydrogenase/oxidase-like isoform X1 [Orbicella faveolata]XP_020627785.1 xanthine dehydrogenase/oxidase-like isoform X2 [Orbicella faveolata]
MISKYDHENKKIKHLSANGCLLPLCAVDGMAVTTVEGIGSTKTALHPVQERIAKSHGSQCGFCTPGIVMSMYALLRNNPLPTHKEMESAFEGNLCRCTGYRPILEGFKTFTKECCSKGGNGCCKETNQNGTCNGTVQNGVLNGANELFKAAEFAPYDPTQDVIFPPELMLPEAAKPKSLYIKGDLVTWIRPTTLEELLELKMKHPKAKLVIGNTEIGIEMKFKKQNYPVLIAPTHIPELNAVEHTSDGIKFGASVTLTTLEDVLNEACHSMPEYKTRWFTAILHMLKWFAGHQIRNVGAIGGNIMTASPISDLNPVFMAARCTLTLAAAGGKTRKVKLDENFFTGYRRTVLQPSEVLVDIFIPFTEKHEYVFAFKQARRREDDIAIVNTGMRVLLEKPTNSSSWKIQDCSFSFGGMAPTTVMAMKTIKGLTGRTWSESIVEDACQLLAEDLPLKPGSPGGQVEYRRSLGTSFFFKFYLNVSVQLSNQEAAPKVEIPKTFVSGTGHFLRDVTYSTQTFQEVPDDQSIEDVVGRPVAHLAAAKQATGEAIYCDDIPKYAGELYLAAVFSKRAHAKILDVDPSEALHLPGVKTYLGVDDVPGQNATGPVIFDEEVFASEKVTCVGQIIGAIVAETQAQAQRAANSVKVTYEDLPRILTIEEAIAAQSFLESTPMCIQKGDLETGFAESDHVLEGEMRVGGQEHFYLETQATIAVPKGEDGEMELFVSTQNPTLTQKLVAKALGVPANRIVVRVKRMGGGFGGKETRNCFLSSVVAVAAAKVGKPVRCMLDRDEDMMSTGTRHPFLANYKVGFTVNGKIKALDVKMYSNAGNSLDLSKAVMERALFHMENCYLIPNIRGQGYMCKTNIPSNTAFRGFGGPQGMMFAESWIGDIAVTCGISQRQVRELNFYHEGDVTHFNQELASCHIQRVWDELVYKCKYEERREHFDAFNRENRWRKRGIALTPTKFGISFTALFMNQAGALVHVYTDGSVLVTHGGTEMGQGLHTKMVQVAARSFGIPLSKIHISETSTNTVANTSPTAASASSDLNGMAVKIACEQILERLKPYQMENPKGTWEDWVRSAYFDRVNLSANGFYRTPDLGYDWKTNTGRVFNYFCFGAACSEVEVDCLTGDHQVLRTDIVMDVGTSLNPAIDIGQVEGGFVQGLGLFTLEEVRYSQSGSLWTMGPGAYKIPGFADIPVEFYVHLLRSAPNEKAVYSSKAVGEPPLFLASSVFYAIKDAVMAARRESGVEGIFRLDSPATSERIRMACVDQFTKQV